MRLCRTALALSLIAVMGTAQAGDDRIARWTDADGITQFGDARFAPATATKVEVAPTNGMTVPTHAPASSSKGPAWTVISRAPKQNPIGWRAKRKQVNGRTITTPR